MRKLAATLVLTTSALTMTACAMPPAPAAAGGGESSSPAATGDLPVTVVGTGTAPLGHLAVESGAMVAFIVDYPEGLRQMCTLLRPAPQGGGRIPLLTCSPIPKDGAPADAVITP